MREYVPPKDMPQFEELHLHDTFSFSCHSGMSCFNKCCRDLNQFLTPYDILRLKKHLELTSEQFLKTYTHHHMGPRSGLPVVSLKTYGSEGLRCPFVTPSGCRVYEDRPASCRIYPLGRIAKRRSDAGACDASYFLIREGHCFGHGGSTKWTVREWERDQGLAIYNEMNDLVMELLALKGRSGRKRLTPTENDLFYMAFYDLDRFRGFAFEKRLCDEADHPERKEIFKKDDVALLRFSMEWIKGRLFGSTG
jgi:hypothetical protein